MTIKNQQYPPAKMRQLMEILGNPQNELKFVHVAGTNGKGSVSCFIASALMQSGYKVGLYTSPYLQKFNERIRVDGKSIPQKDLEEIFSLIEQKGRLLPSDPSEFEKVTAAGFLYFARMHCDIVVLEVGVGGLKDPTNVISDSLVSVITSIGLDHMEKLGDTKEEIALQKAGIIKENGLVAVSFQQPEVLCVISDVCRQKNACMKISQCNEAVLLKKDLNGQSFTLPSYGEFEISLLGKNQIENASVAVEALKLMEKRGIHISDEAIKAGLKKALWAGRFENVGTDPCFILDCGHNIDGIISLKENVKDFFPDKKPVVITGVMKDKDFHRIYEEIDEIASSYVAINCDYERALPCSELAEHLKVYNKPVFSCEIIADGIKKAKQQALENDTFVLAAGSVYTCGDIRTIITGDEEVPVIKI